ncbi:MAG: hypothetical protein R2793_00515 [Flavobacteriaceae bacterium]
MSVIAYKPLFRLELLHDYFENGQAKGLILEPGANTQALMQRYGIVINTVSSRKEVYFKANETVADFLAYIKNTTSLDFFDFSLRVEDPNFYMFTALPFAEKQSYAYASSHPQNETFGNNIVLAGVAETQDGSFAKVQIYFQDIIDAVSEIPNYQLQFRARATRWDYYIINRSNLPLEGLTLETQEDFTFEGPKAVTLENGQDALWFTSGNQLLPLSEVPHYKFNLLTQLQGAGERTHSQKVITGLPVPNLSNFRIFKENGVEGLSSPMYIYV